MRAKERIYLLTFLISFCSFLISPSVLIILQQDQEVVYFFDLSEEEENKEEGKEKEMNENFVVLFHDLSMLSSEAGASVFFHLKKEGKDIFQAPVLPPPEGLS